MAERTDINMEADFTTALNVGSAAPQGSDPVVSIGYNVAAIIKSIVKKSQFLTTVDGA